MLQDWEQRIQIFIEDYTMEKDSTVHNSYHTTGQDFIPKIPPAPCSLGSMLTHLFTAMRIEKVSVGKAQECS